MSRRGTIGALMGGHRTAEIICAIKGTVVRRLAVRPAALHGSYVEVDALTESVLIPSDAPLVHEEWVFDRGNVLVDANGVTGAAARIVKLCTVFDRIRFPDGTEQHVTEKDCV